MSVKVEVSLSRMLGCFGGRIGRYRLAPDGRSQTYIIQAEPRVIVDPDGKKETSGCNRANLKDLTRLLDLKLCSAMFPLSLAPEEIAGPAKESLSEDQQALPIVILPFLEATQGELASGSSWADGFELSMTKASEAEASTFIANSKLSRTGLQNTVFVNGFDPKGAHVSPKSLFSVISRLLNSIKTSRV